MQQDTHEQRSLRTKPGWATTTGLDATPLPSYLSKLAGGGGGSWGGGGGYWQLGGGGGAAHNPLLSHAYLKGVSGGMGVQRYVCSNSDILSLPGRKF